MENIKNPDLLMAHNECIVCNTWTDADMTCTSVEMFSIL